MLLLVLPPHLTSFNFCSAHRFQLVVCQAKKELAPQPPCWGEAVSQSRSDQISLRWQGCQMHEWYGRCHAFGRPKEEMTILSHASLKYSGSFFSQSICCQELRNIWKLMLAKEFELYDRHTQGVEGLSREREFIIKPPNTLCYMKKICLYFKQLFQYSQTQGAYLLQGTN